MQNDIRDREFSKFRAADNDKSKLACAIEQDPLDPIPVLVAPGLPAGYSTVSHFGQVSSVASGILTTVLSKTITTTSLDISSIEVSGDNKSEYSIFLNTVLVAKKRTYYTNLNESFWFNGLKVITGDLIEIKTIHNRPSSGDFEARIIGVEIA